MIRIGLIGAGTMGNVHSRALRQIPGARLTAVCDIVEEKARHTAEDWQAQAFTSMEEMLRHAPIDAVDICLPTDLHRQAAEMAAACGKHVFCEKPIALTAEDAQAMIVSCRKAGVMLMVGHVVRFFPEYRAAREQVISGRLGSIGVVRTIRSGAYPVWSDWFADERRSGGPLLDLAIHDFDYLRWCFGPVKRVFSQTLTASRNRLEHTLTVLRFQSGVIAHVEASWAYPKESPFQTSIEIAGSKGLVLFDKERSNSILQFGGPKQQTAVPDSPLAKSPYTLELEHFVECVTNGQPPLTSGEESLASLLVGLAAVRSAKTKLPVECEVGQG